MALDMNNAAATAEAPDSQPPAALPPFRPRGRIVRAEEVQAWHSGQSYLEAAKREAKRIRAEATAAVANERRRGFEEGRRQGTEAAARLLAETRAKADRYLLDADEQLVDLALAVVRRVLGEFEVDDLLATVVRQELTRQRRDQRLTFHVAPEMLDSLRREIAGIVDDQTRDLIRVEPDPRIEPGACRMASDVGFVELGIEAQLRALHQGLKDGLKQAARD